MITEFAKSYQKKMFDDEVSKLYETDPEFVERFDNFAFDEVINRTNHGEYGLDDKTRMMVILSYLLGCQGIDEFRVMLQAALNCDVTPVEIKEIVYQAVAYLGIGRVFPFLNAVNEIFEKRGIKLPLENQSHTTSDTRLQDGNQAQVDIFGEGMREFYTSGPEETRHINVWLAANCFCDYYTRSGLTLRQRELITFCFISAQGGCEPQLTAHSVGNMKVGNSREFLINVVSAGIPFIGYPRSLNALQCVNNAAKQLASEK